jgi:hypothetical protein
MANSPTGATEPSSSKAQAADPYLEEGSIIEERLTVAGYELPPILHGVQKTGGLGRTPTFYNVSVMHIARQQIDTMLCAILREKPELAQAFDVVHGFLMRLDTIRDEVQNGLMNARLHLSNDITPERKEMARESLLSVARMLGSWDEPHRIFLR